MADSNLVILSNRNAKSAIWAYFRFYPNVNGEPEDRTQPICTICKKCVPVKDKQTTNLFGHMTSTTAARSGAAAGLSTNASQQPTISAYY